MKRLFVILPICCCLPAIAASEPSSVRQADLASLVRNDCGACHGLTLKGGLGPALSPETLAGKNAESLESTILGGRPGTPMPPWARFLSTDDVAWIVKKLLAGFPKE